MWSTEEVKSQDKPIKTLLSSEADSREAGPTATMQSWPPNPTLTLVALALTLVWWLGTITRSPDQSSSGLDEVAPRLRWPHCSLGTRRACSIGPGPRWLPTLPPPILAGQRKACNNLWLYSHKCDMCDTQCWQFWGHQKISFPICCWQNKIKYTGSYPRFYWLQTSVDDWFILLVTIDFTGWFIPIVDCNILYSTRIHFPCYQRLIQKPFQPAN